MIHTSVCHCDRCGAGFWDRIVACGGDFSWNNLTGSVPWWKAIELITLGVVLRAQAGQLYELSDGARVCLGRIESVKRERVEFALLEELPANEPKLRVTLLLSVVKFDSFEWAIEKATELGVTSIVPLAAERSEKGLLAAAEKRSERWRKIILEAAQQSRRVRLPVLQPVARPEGCVFEGTETIGNFSFRAGGCASVARRR